MKATSKQKGLIHILADECGIYEKGNKKDGLHRFVYQLTLKLSIAELTVDEAERVISHLKQNLKAVKNEPIPMAAIEDAITKDQVSKIFGLAYELRSLDKEPSTATIRQRIGGVYKKVLQVNPPVSGDIMKGLSYEQGDKLIREFKRYVKNAKRKAVKHGQETN